MTPCPICHRPLGPGERLDLRASSVSPGTWIIEHIRPGFQRVDAETYCYGGGFLLVEEPSPAELKTSEVV